MKISVIGGGSSYTPELLDGLLARSEKIGLLEVALNDVDAGRLEIVSGFARRMAEARGSRVKITATLELASAVSGADFIIAQIRVGGNQARLKDEQLGLRHGLIGQETTGVGGLAKALRTIPAMRKICAVIEQRAPAAVLINFTNPSGLVTEALLKHTKVKTIGLCNIPITFHLELAQALRAERNEIAFDYIGLNHLAWVREVRLNGKDVTARVLALAGGAEQPAHLQELDYPPGFIKTLGMIPMHYLRYYYLTGRMLEEQRKKPKQRAEEVMEIEAELFKIYADPNAKDKPELLSRRGGAHYSQAALELIEAMIFDTDERQALNARNGDTIPGLPADAVIEVWCRAGKDGARPLAVRPPEPMIMGLMRAVKSYEELAVEAAVQRDRGAALLALIAHPLGPDVDHAEEVLDDIMITHDLKLK